MSRLHYTRATRQLFTEHSNSRQFMRSWGRGRGGYVRGEGVYHEGLGPWLGQVGLGCRVYTPTAYTDPHYCVLQLYSVYFLPKCVNIEKQVLFRFFRRTLLILR